MIAPSLDWLPKDGSSLNKFGMMINKLWKNLSATFAPFWLAAALYVPVITSGAGVFTSASATGRYYQLGRIVFVQIVITITTNGTASNYVVATLPFLPASGIIYILAGRANAVSAKMLQGVVNNAASPGNVIIENYDGTYPGATGEVLIVSGFYETQ
jgi:hypothetical protein